MNRIFNEGLFSNPRLFRWVQKTIFCAGLSFSAVGYAYDTDLFISNPGSSSENPNVMILIDNTANWSSSLDSNSKFDAEMLALKTIVDGLDDQVNVGLMMLTKPNKGGYIRFGLRPMTAANRTALKNTINTLDVNSDKTSGGAPYGIAMFDLFKYLGGGGTDTGLLPSPQSATAFGTTTYAGASDSQRDYEGNTFYSPRLPAPFPLSSNADKTFSETMTDTCQKNYLIILSNGSPPTSSDAGADTLLRNVGGNTVAIPLSSSRSQASYADEFARFLYQNDVNPLPGKQNVVTYTLGVYSAPARGTDPDNILLMKSTAQQGRGRYFDATNTAAVQNALQLIFNEVQAIDSVFASVTLPVSVNVRGTNLNQVYMGIFRPDGLGLPQWDGNLKQYQLKFDDDLDNVFLADSRNLSAMNNSTGFIVDDAVSFWSKESNYWAFAPSGTPASASDAPDGAVVEKGGAAQRLRESYLTTPTTRKVYTCTGACVASSGSLLKNYKFDNTTLNPATVAVQTQFGVASSADVTNLMNWIKGQDNSIDENSNGSLTDVRARIHGDVLHSRPAVINYNRDSSDNDIVIFYGANDGLLHAVKGGRDLTGGEELWSLALEEFYPKFKKLRENNVPTLIEPKPIFIDGSITTWQEDDDGDGVIESGDRTYIFLSMRRGGRFIYALDVTTPENPKFLWRKKHTDTGYSELGETWSAPSVIKLKANNGYGLIFGAGYDSAVEDLDPIPVGRPNTKGRGILVADIHTGKVLWQVGPTATGAEYNVTESEMKYSIPSDLTNIDRNRDGYHDRAYVGDTGGNVWRIDFADTWSDWSVHKIASVGFDSFNNKTHRRKFLYPPDVVYSSDPTGSFDAVLLGTGDRENPFNGFGSLLFPLSNAVENHFYMFKDRSVSGEFSGSVITLSDLYDATSNVLQDGTDIQKQLASTQLAESEGIVLKLNTGEKVVTSAITLGGTTYFSTNQPNSEDTGSCAGSLGTARQYEFSFKDFTALNNQNDDETLNSDDRITVRPGGGFPPSPVPIVVELEGTIHEVVCSGVSCEKVEGEPLNTRYRTYWYEEFD